jgi:hypothetical protein
MDAGAAKPATLIAKDVNSDRFAQALTNRIKT